MSNARFIIDPSGEPPVVPVPKVKNVHPFGSTILVEMLNANEILGTKLTVKDTANVGAPQAYVIEVGPKLDKDAGVKAGDRVLLQGTYVPVPKLAGDTRSRGIVELHNVKAVLEEADPEEE